jgi:NADH-quinone oxidoreductase subunit H
MAGALALLPALAGGAGFTGDLILLVGLLELPPLCLILAGYASRSIFGEVGATREAVVSIACNAPFLAALLALATAGGTLRLQELAAATPWTVRAPALLAILLCLPVKLRLNPFSLSNAEQEILAGPLTELDGRWLALWELAHALEWVALTGLVAALVFPPSGASALLDGLRLGAVSLALVPPLTLLGAATGRLKLGQVTRWLWRWPTLAAVAAVVVAQLVRRP